MICWHCKQEIKDSLGYCPYCGRKIPHIKNRNSRTPVTVKEDNQSENDTLRGKRLEVLSQQGNKAGRLKVTALLLVLVLIFGSFYLSGLRKPVKNGTESADPAETGSDSADETPDSSGTGTGPDEEMDSEPIEVVTIDANIPAGAVIFEGHSYYIFDNSCESWNEARRYCEGRGGYLAVINSSEENEFLYDYMIRTGFDEVFMGYTDQNLEGRWEWVSGKNSSFEDWGVNDEGSQEPNADSIYENYAHMNSAMHNGHWNDKNFGKTTSCYFCEWDMISYQGEKRKGTAVEDGVPMKSDSQYESAVILKLDRDEEVRVLYCLTKDDGQQWYYVQHKTGIIGYIESELLNVTE